MRKLAPSSEPIEAKRHTLKRWLLSAWGSWLIAPAFVALSVSLIFGFYGWSIYRREARELNSVFEANFALLARAIEVASEHALRDSETEDLDKLIRSLERLDAHFEVSILGPDGRVWFSSSGSDPLDEEIFEAVTRTFETGKAEALQIGLGVERAAIRTASLDVEGMPTAILLLRKPMGALMTDLGHTRRYAWTVAILLAVASMLVSTAAMFLRVRAPLRKIRRMMTNIRNVNDLGIETSVSSALLEDDVRRLAETFEAMMQRLNHSREEVLALHRERHELTKRIVEQDGRTRLAQFASELAHEIGSPLQIIMGRAAQLESRADRPDDVRRNARIVVDACHRVQQAIEASLRAAYLHPRGQGEIDVVKRLEMLQSVCISEDAEAPLVFTQRATDGEWKITMDEDAFDQISRNLLSNALEASASTRSDVVIDLYDEGDWRWLVLRDQGPGIDESMLKAIFKPWFTTKAGGTGHGFGLPIVERLCRDLGLQLILSSEIGVGTEVKVGFPFERASHPANLDNSSETHDV